MALSLASALFFNFIRNALSAYPAAGARAWYGAPVALLVRSSRQDVYNVLWAVVFGFATLNILSLAARRSELPRRGLSLGELMAVSVVLVSLFLLGWEMLNVFHIFPIKLRR